jgi:cyclic pyranopterin phosphate synthase
VSRETIEETVRSQFGQIERLPDPRHSTSANYKVKGHQGSFGIVSTITNPFCADCNRIRLTADGKMKNCLFATAETDLLNPFRKGDDIQKLIVNSIKTKKYSRDGMDVNMEAKHYEKNRSMISIGG